HRCRRFWVRRYLRWLPFAALLLRAERVDVDRHHLDGRIIEAPAPGRHHAHTGIGDLRDDIPLLATIEPNLVGKIRCSELGIALALGAMAGRAVLGEDHGAALRGFGILRALRK